VKTHRQYFNELFIVLKFGILTCWYATSTKDGVSTTQSQRRKIDICNTVIMHLRQSVATRTAQKQTTMFISLPLCAGQNDVVTLDNSVTLLYNDQLSLYTGPLYIIVSCWQLIVILGICTLLFVSYKNVDVVCTADWSSWVFSKYITFMLYTATDTHTQTITHKSTALLN